MDYIKKQSGIWGKVEDIKEEKINQLRQAIKEARVDKMVETLNEINEVLMLRVYDDTVDEAFRLRVIDSIRKNYEFMAKVTDTGNSMIMDEVSSAGTPGNFTIEVNGAIEPINIAMDRDDQKLLEE